ncbi:MAG: TetR/AcrR family transcriptional regulator [Deltaproteobacteria bacterium]|nr:TetR/AcrR family transcriptional regulator [Deltaproteobacteria bacterium]
MNNKKLQNPNSKERILRTAISLFARKGFAETGMRELASKAEVNLSMVNYFFGSKKGLLKEILDDFFSGYLAIAREELTDPEDLQSRLERFITSAVNYFEAERDSLIITISELPHDDPEIVEHKAAWARQMVEIVNQELCLPHSEKTGQNIPPTCLAPMLTSLMASRFLFGPLMEKVQTGSFKAVTTEDYTKMLVGILLQGITGAEKKSDERNI